MMKLATNSSARRLLEGASSGRARFVCNGEASVKLCRLGARNVALCPPPVVASEGS